jgi:hypothetical protein
MPWDALGQPTAPTVEDVRAGKVMYSQGERMRYKSPPCPQCGYQGNWRTAEWQGRLLVDGEVAWSPGRLRCTECGHTATEPDWAG